MKKAFRIISTFAIMAMVLGLSSVFGMETSETVSMGAISTVSTPLLNQQAEREMIKQFRHDNSWLSELRSKNNWVNNDVIKIPKRGTVPNVLINNEIYPIVSNKREDSHVVISLNKYDTENTTVTEDELYALPYEKTSDVQMQHREELEDVTAEHGLHSLSPAQNTSTTPVIECTGAEVDGRKTLKSADLVTLKGKLDKLKVPKKGRVLVLCSDHVSDLLNEDRTFYQQYHNAKDGVLSPNYYGFKLYESTYNPTYFVDAGDANTIKKVAFDAVSGDLQASICFHKKTATKARGSVKRFMKKADDSPEMRESTIGFRVWFIAVAIKDEGVGAIVG